MTSMITKSALLGGALAIGLAGLAFAAPADPAKVEKRVMIMRDGPGGPGGPGRGMRFHHRGDPAQHAQHLRDVLQLTPAQEPALQAYIEATRPEAMSWQRRERKAPDGARPDAPPAPPKMLTTPERLDRQAEMMAKRQAAFAKKSAAIKTFYGQLTAPQRKAFDALGIDGGGRGMHGRDVRFIRRAGGDSPMAFGADGGDMEMAFGAFEDFELEFDMPDMPDMPEPPQPPEAPGA